MRRAVLLVLLALAAVGLARPGRRCRRMALRAAGRGRDRASRRRSAKIGDVEFWAPNRGMLITAGNGGIPAGLFAYDGTGWYRYSTVCGGHEGRIAWAGPDEFWTISDQPLGQETGKAPPAAHLPLPLQGRPGRRLLRRAASASPSSYLPMNAAACSGPDDCWFAGERLPGTTNVGAFHLHWDGATLTAVPSLTDPQPEIVDPGRSVESLAFHQGGLYESVAMRRRRRRPRDESASQPSFLHRIAEGAADPFEPLCDGRTDRLRRRAPNPTQLEAFRLSGDGEGLWAIAGAESAPATVTALRLGAEGFEQVAARRPGRRPRPGRPGRRRRRRTRRRRRLGRVPRARRRRLTRPPASPASTPTARSTRRPCCRPKAKGSAARDAAGPIACPAAGQCWMATGKGWLFHLGPDLPAGHRPGDARARLLPPARRQPAQRAADLAARRQLRAPNRRPKNRRSKSKTRCRSAPAALYSKLHQRLIGKQPAGDDLRPARQGARAAGRPAQGPGRRRDPALHDGQGAAQPAAAPRPEALADRSSTSRSTRSEGRAGR